MPTPKQIRTNDLTAGKEVLIRGRVVYSHVASHISGAALDKANADATARGRPTHNKPYTTITLCEAQLIPMTGQDPNVLTTEQQYVLERMFDSRSQGYTGKCYQAESKSPNLPAVMMFNNQTGYTDPVPSLDGEFAKGMDVTLVMKVFDAKPNKGFGLDSIICNEAIRYFGRTPMAPVLANYGYKLSAEPTPRAPGSSTPSEMPMPEDAYPESNVPPMPAPGAPVPPPAPGTDPYSTQQPPANAYGYAQNPPQTPPAGYPQAGAPAQTPPAGYPAQTPPAGYPQAGAPAQTPPAGYPAQTPPAGYPQAGAPTQSPPPAAGPFTPQPAYPGPTAGGINYNPDADPARQY